jgi:hypothetical protein
MPYATHVFFVLATLLFIRARAVDDDNHGVDWNHDAFGEVHGLGEPCLSSSDCGAAGACCMLGSSATEDCDFGRAGCEQQWCCVRSAMHEISGRVSNHGEHCLEACEEPGLCEHRCGSNGACCRKGSIFDGEDCANGAHGCEQRHCCVLAATSVLPPASALLPETTAGPCSEGGSLERHNTDPSHGDICRMPGFLPYNCPKGCAKKVAYNPSTRAVQGAAPYCTQSETDFALPCRTEEVQSSSLDVLAYTTEERLCAHDNATDARFTPPMSRIPDWVSPNGDEVVENLAKAALAPWAARGTITQDDLERAFATVERLDGSSGTRRFCIIRIQKGYAIVSGSYDAPGTPRWAAERARQVVHMSSRLAAKRPDLAVEIVVSLSDCICTRSWNRDGSAYARAKRRVGIGSKTRKCNANYNTVANENFDRLGPAPIFTAVACLDSDDIPLPVFDASFRGHSPWGEDLFQGWAHITREISNSSLRASRNPRVAFRGGVNRGGVCKLGSSSAQKCGRAKLGELVDERSDIFAEVPIGSNLKDFSKFLLAVAVENYCGWQSSTKLLLWMRVGVLLQESFCSEFTSWA